jgi:hypothetical protein
MLTLNPGIAQIAYDGLLVFGGKLPNGNQKTSKCYVIAEDGQENELRAMEGPSLDHRASFETAFVNDGLVIAIQNN